QRYVSRFDRQRASKSTLIPYTTLFRSRKKCKRMRHVFYRPYEELSDNQNWYLKRYLGMSNYLKRAYQLKEAYRYWFEESKTLGDNDLVGIKQRLYQF